MLLCDKNIVKVEQEKIQSSQNLAGLIREIYRTVAQVVPFVVGAISRNSSASQCAQVVSLLGIIHMLRKVLCL